jgi:hypothetical protein
VDLFFSSSTLLAQGKEKVISDENVGIIPTLALKIFGLNWQYTTFGVQILTLIFHPKIQPLVY